MKKLTAFLVAFLLASMPSGQAAIGTPTQLGTANGTTTAVITTVAIAGAGSLIIVVVSVATNNVAVTSVVDSAGNCSSYNALDNAATASRPTVAVFYCANTGSSLASGATITVTVPSTDKVSATAFYVSGMSSSPADIHAKQVNGASGTAATSTSTGTLSSHYELVVGALALGSTSSAFVPGTSFTSIGGLSSSNGSVYAAWQINCTTRTQAFAPTWTTSNAYMSDVVSFEIAGPNSQCLSKTNAYEILDYGTAAQQSASKTDTYEILNYGTAAQQSASKSNAYEILNYGTAGQESMSKANAYVILQSAGPNQNHVISSIIN